MPKFREEDLQAVSAFLDKNWDPIGVYSEPLCGWHPGEYDLYAPTILGDLYAGADHADVLRHLREGCTQKGLEEAPDRGRDVEVASLCSPGGRPAEGCGN